MIKVANFSIGNNEPFVLIAGPCQLESVDHSRFMVNNLLSICERTNVNLIFKGSFDKANRTSIHSRRGVGIDAGLKILETIRKEFNVPVLTDVHEPSQVESVASVVDVLQIPAFLCRQTDLLVEAAKAATKYSRAVNIKKGQWLAPNDMSNVAEKFTTNGCDQIMLCERGTAFGYNRLINDFTGLPIMAQMNFPVIFDATHSVQQPGGLGSSSGGNRQFVPYLARAAIAVGCAGLFIETHEDPDIAPSDGPNMMPLDKMEALLVQLKQIDSLIKR